MKKSLRCCLAVLLIVMLMPFSLLNVSAREGFDIDHYDVSMVIGNNGEYHVTETLNVRFRQKLHGIYMNIPTRYENMKWTVDGKEVIKNYSFPVSNVKVLSGHKSDIDRETNGIQIRLGDKDTYANTNEVYQVSYTIQSRDLGLGGIQSFYYNLIAVNGWDTDIHRTTFKIQMPSEFDASQLYFYPSSKLDPNLLITQVTGNTISGSYEGTIPSLGGLTVKLDLPEGYFEYPKPMDYSLYITIASGLLLIASLLLYFKFGHDDKVITTVEFEAPDGISSAAVGYIIDGSVETRDVISLILDWGHRGYLRIEQEEDTLKMTKLKDMGDEAELYEKRMFKAMFKKRETVTTDQLKETFYTHLEQAKSDVSHWFSGKRSIFTSDSKFIQGFLMLVAGLPISILTALHLYHYYYEPGIAFLLFGVQEVLVLAASGLLILVRNKWYVYGGMAKFGLIFLDAFLAAILAIITFVLTYITGNNMLFALLILAVTCFLVVLTCFMQKRTKYGTDVFGRVLGLKDFIEHAEKERLEMLVKENPQYFYDVLPYAYAFNMTDIWAEHFKFIDIEPVGWYGYNGNFTTIMMLHHLSHSMNSIQTSMSIPAPSANTGGGGGFGGGGGGGFSGGGFGGTSGGGW